MCIVPVISTLNKASSVLMFFFFFSWNSRNIFIQTFIPFLFNSFYWSVFVLTTFTSTWRHLFFFFGGGGILACNHANMIKQDSKHAKSYSCYKCWWHEYGTTRIYTTLWSSCTNMSLDGTWDACTIYGPPVLAGTYFWKTKIVMMASLFYTMYAQWTGTR